MANQRSQTGKNTRSHNRNMARRSIKRQEANIRNDKWASLTPTEQLADLDRRGYRAVRQRARIKARIEV
jgi:hypothetical protein